MAARNRTPSRGLTPKFIDALQPDPARRYYVVDRCAPGLRLRVFPSGVKTFSWPCTSRQRVFTIGPWTMCEQPGFVTLAQARDWLEKLKAGHAAGTVAEVEAALRVHLRRRPHVAEAAPEPADRRTFGTVAEEFYRDDVLVNRKHPDAVRAMLDTDLLPALGARPLDAITTLECRDVIRRIVTGHGRLNSRAAPTHAGKVLAVLKQTFSWAQANGFTERNPAAALRADKLGVRNDERTRYLSAEEIPLFWRALDAEPEPQPVQRPDPRTGKTQTYEQRVPALAPATRAALRLLLMTGARTGALLKARWASVDLDAATWTIPPADQKLTKKRERTARPFVLPLAPTALALFKALRALAGDSPWVMAGGGASGHYQEQALGHAVHRLVERGAVALPGGPISPHDLRRTMRTHLGETLGVPPHIAERSLNHSLGRIVRTYDRGDYLAERRAAMEKWDAYVQRLLAPATNVVAFLPAAGSAR